MAKPDDIRFTDQLPKTRSGKIMRRLLRELASSGEVKGDVTTLEDLGVISPLAAGRRVENLNRRGAHRVPPSFLADTRLSLMHQDLLHLGVVQLAHGL